MVFFKEALRQSLAVMTVAFNEFNGGMSLGWTAPTISALQKPDSILPVTVEEFSWIASTDNLGRIIGCLISAALMDIVGRTPLLAFSALTFAFSWLLLLTKSVFMICVMRMLLGIASGIESGTNCVYIGENSSPSIRGVFGTVSLALYHSGMFIEFIIASHLSYETTAIANTCLQFCLFFATFWMREPAQFLLTKGKEKRAFNNFVWLRGATAPEDVLKEFELIKLNAESESRKRSSFRQFFTSRANYKSVSIMVIMYVLVAMVGYSAILACATVTFTNSELFTPNQFTILFGVIKVFFAVSASFMVNRFRRRTLLLTTFSSIAIVHGCIALLYYLHENAYQFVYFPWMIFASVSVFAAIFAFAYPAVFMVRSELFPLSIRAFGSCASLIGFSLANFIVTKIFLLIHQNYGIHFNFLLFSASSSLLVIFVYLVLPETRNKSLIEIQRILEK